MANEEAYELAELSVFVGWCDLLGDDDGIDHVGGEGSWLHDQGADSKWCKLFDHWHQRISKGTIYTLNRVSFEKGYKDI